MGKTTRSIEPVSHPHLWRWVTEHRDWLLPPDVLVHPRARRGLPPLFSLLAFL